jgi:hypothetical protein
MYIYIYAYNSIPIISLLSTSQEPKLSGDPDHLGLRTASDQDHHHPAGGNGLKRRAWQKTGLGYISRCWDGSMKHMSFYPPCWFTKIHTSRILGLHLILTWNRKFRGSISGDTLRQHRPGKWRGIAHLFITKEWWFSTAMTAMLNFQRVSSKIVSMDCFNGKSTGNHVFFS